MKINQLLSNKPEKNKEKEEHKGLRKIYFEIMFMLSSHYTISNETEAFSVIVELCQLLSFSFHKKLGSIWKLDWSFNNFSNFFHYFLITNFFVNSQTYYIILFCFSIIIILINEGFKIYAFVQVIKNRTISTFCLKTIANLSIPFSSILFLPMLKIFLGSFEMENDTNLYGINNASLRIILGTIGIIFSLYLAILSLLVHYSLFHVKLNKDHQGAKYTSYYERSMLIIKIILTICFYVNFSNWILGLIIFCFSSYLLFFYYTKRPHYSLFLQKIKLLAAILFFWSALMIILGILLSASLFNGCLPLMFLGGLLITCTGIINKNTDSQILFQNPLSITDPHAVFIYIRCFLNLLRKITADREAKILLNGYIQGLDHKSITSHSPIHKYKESNSKPSSIIYLYQHAALLYESAITKFPHYILLRISYGMLLNDLLNKKQEAFKEIIAAKKYSPNIEEEFILYKYEHEFSDINGVSDIAEGDVDAISAMTYKHNFISFKNALLKLSLFYVEFWSLLLNRNEDQEQLINLNQLGNKITILIQEIHFLFEKLQKMNVNDEEVLFYYSEFCNNILNDEEKTNQYKKRYDQLQEEKEDNEEVNLGNINIKNLGNTDKFQFIILSTQHESFGNIVNISLGLCIQMGYTKHELVGKTIDILIPELLRKEHNKMLHSTWNEYKDEITNKDMTNENHQKKMIKEVEVFATNKAKYLVQMSISVAICHLESHEAVYIAQVFIIPSTYNFQMTQNQNTCYILTNNNFIIQNYTVNAMNLLGLQSFVMNGKIELTFYIKQFHEEFLSQALSNEDLTLEQKLVIKRNIIATKYRLPIIVSWKKFECDSIQYSSKLLWDQDSWRSDSHLFGKPGNEQKTGFMGNIFYLNVLDASIRNKQEGYLFKFELVNSKNKRVSNSSKRASLTTNFNKISTNKANLYSSYINSQSQFGLACSSSHNLIPKETTVDYLSTIPQNNNKIYFQINPKSMAFVIQKNPNNNYQEILRNEALKKMEFLKEDDDSSIYEDDEEEDDSVENTNTNDEDDSSDFSKSVEKEDVKQSIVSVSKSPRKGLGQLLKNKPIIDENTYYKVDFTHIKLSIYDFEKKVIVERKDYEKISQIDIQKGNTIASKDKFSITESKKKDKNEIITEGEETQIDSEILTQKIQYALKGEENQPTITKFKLTSCLIFIILLVNGIIWTMSVFNNFSKMKISFTYIEGSLYLKYLSLKGIINVRSLVLIQNPRYTNYFYSREKDLSLLIEDSNYIYYTIHKIVRTLIYSDIHMSYQKNYDYVMESKVLCREIMEFNLSMNTYNHTIFSAINQVNTAFFHIITEKFDKIPLNNIVYLYMQNSLNELGEVFNKLALIYEEEFIGSVAECKIELLIILLCFIPLYFLSYIFLMISYGAVMRRKESYLAVFFEIKNNVIYQSLEKCEKFTKQIQTDNLNDFCNVEDEEDSISYHTLKINKDSMNNKSIAQNSNKENKSSHLDNSKEVIFVKWITGIVIFLCFVCNMIFYFVFTEFEDGSTVQISAYLEQSQMQLEYINLYVSLSEFVFDPKKYVNLRPSKENFISSINPFYSETIANKKNIVSSNQHNLPEKYAPIFYDIYYRDVCSYTEFPPDIECSTFLFSSTKNGLEIITSVFFNELLEWMHQQIYLESYHIFNNFTYNLTYIGTSYEKDLYPKTEDLIEKYESLHQIILFNDLTYQLLMRIYWFILRPCFQILTENYSEGIYIFFNKSKILFLSLTFGYIALLSLFYFFFWKSYENQLNNMIFKTKNMLLIIPVNVLVTLQNIQILLGLTSLPKTIKK